MSGVEQLRAENADLRRRVAAQAAALNQYRMATDWLDAEPWRDQITEPRMVAALSAMSSARKAYDGSTGPTAGTPE